MPGFGPWNTSSSLNALFPKYADQEETLTKLSDAISDLEDGSTLTVTHQVIGIADTGLSVGSGDLLRLYSL